MLSSTSCMYHVLSVNSCSDTTYRPFWPLAWWGYISTLLYSRSCAALAVVSDYDHGLWTRSSFQGHCRTRSYMLLLPLRRIIRTNGYRTQLMLTQSHSYKASINLLYILSLIIKLEMVYLLLTYRYSLVLFQLHYSSAFQPILLCIY